MLQALPCLRVVELFSWNFTLCRIEVMYRSLCRGSHVQNHQLMALMNRVSQYLMMNSIAHSCRSLLRSLAVYPDLFDGREGTNHDKSAISISN